MKPKQPDWDEVAAHEAGKGGDETQCFFCDRVLHVDDLAGAPEGSSQEIQDMYACRPRCMSCDIDIRMRLNAALIKGIESVFAHTPKTVERSEDEKQALDEIYREQDHEALSAADVDRMAEEHGDGRFYP
jgi:hypothetical protein